MGIKKKVFQYIEQNITDADALPSDVTNGKVFYNNDGRQVGNGNFLKEKTIQLTARKYSSSLSGVIEFIGNNGITSNLRTGPRRKNGDSINLQDAMYIIGISVGSVYIPFARSLNFSKDYIIEIDNKKLSLAVENSDGNVNISYCDDSYSYDFILHYI